MAINPRDKELTDGRSNKKPPEAPPVDNWGRSLQRQYDPQPDWGRKTENELQKKRQK